jgi:ribosomal protein S18 acetylase RimI-like enzyme
MPEITYEVVDSAPTDAIVELYQAGGWWREDPAWRAVIPQMIRGSFCFLLAREPGGRIVGMGRVLSDGVSDAYIQDVVVLEAYRDRGIGRELVRRLTDRCLEARISWIGLVAEPGTQAFYEPMGFRALEGYVPMLHRDRRDGV